MESWEKVFREGFAPGMSRNALMALRDACVNDDPRLIQGSTTNPPPMIATRNDKCVGSCMIGFSGWQGESLDSVGDVEEYFAEKCFEADKRIGEAAGCRYALNWFDDVSRPVMLAELVRVCNDILASEVCV